MLTGRIEPSCTAVGEQGQVDGHSNTRSWSRSGGDLNAYSGVGPQDNDGLPGTPDFVGSASEIDFLRTRFSDPFIRMNLGNGDHCSNQRIDYIMSSGPYVPVKYETCFDATPSDHPFVLITFEAGDQ